MDKIQLRPITYKDLEIIQQWDPSRGGFDFQDLDAAAVAVNESGDLIGFGAIKTFTEVVVALNPAVHKISTARAHILLFQLGIGVCMQKQVKHVYGFIKNLTYAKVMRKFGFMPLEERLFRLDLIKSEGRK